MTPEMQLRDEINDWRKVRGVHAIDEPEYVDRIIGIIKREQVAAIEYVRDNSSGGGSWRRVIEQVLGKLRGDK